MNRLYEVCFKKCEGERIASKLYSLLWFFGLCGAILSYVELRHDTLLGTRLGDLVVFLLAAANCSTVGYI